MQYYSYKCPQVSLITYKMICVHKNTLFYTHVPMHYRIQSPSGLCRACRVVLPNFL